jgi:hypothetical protein
MERISQGGASRDRGAEDKLMVTELIPRVRDTQVFLRMTAIELRRIAAQAPDIAVELRHVAQQLEAEAEDLARRDTE